MLDDLRTFRSLRSAFPLAALLVLTSIGATTAIYSVVDAVVLRGLPFDEHDRLVAIGERSAAVSDRRYCSNTTRSGSARAGTSELYGPGCAAQVFESIAALASGALTPHEPGTEPEEMRSQRVTAGFTVLREQPVRGRAFTADNEVDGRDRVVVLSDGLWRRRFGADPDIVGKTIPLEGVAYQVVGVMRPGFEYPVGAVEPTDLWVPYVVPLDERVRDPKNFSIYLSVIARLKPGVTIAQAQANLDQISQP
jgi:hypothetical protein